MDAVLLSRIQFAFSVGFHFLFPPITLGLTLIIMIFETAYLKTKDVKFRDISNYLIRILGLIFVAGVATGITLEFSFGTNWAAYSRFIGDIFGPPLAAEAIFAFFIESVFISIMLFGRNRVSKKFYWVAACILFFATHLSAFWIIAANSFMQTPAGFIMVGNRAELTNFWEALFNHSTMIRFTHTVVAAWITGSMMILGISAWYLLKKRFIDASKKLFKVALIIFLITSVSQLFLGHLHSQQVGEKQKAKMAAFEALWDTQTEAPLSVIALPDEEAEENVFEIAIPGWLSYFIFGDTNAEVKGLKDFDKKDRPPVLITFASYHVMIGLGTFFILLAFLITFQTVRKKIWNAKILLLILIFSVPLPHLANQFGWIAAEVGRQPWAIYGVLRTSEAASANVPAEQILFSLITLAVIYLIIFVVFIKILFKFIRKGITEIKLDGY